MKISSSTKITMGVLIAILTVLTPAIGSLLATRQEARAGIMVNNRQDNEIESLRQKDLLLEENIRQILKDTGYIKGKLDQLTERK